MAKPTIFISFSLGNTSVSDYFVDLAIKLSSTYTVVVFSDRQKPEHLILPESIEIKYWPSKRPTKFKDGYFLYSHIKKYKPELTISVFGSVNIFMVTGWICGVPNRIAWVRTLSTQFPQKKIHVLRKSFIYKLSTQLIANSEATKQDVVDNFYVESSKIAVLPNSVKNYNSSLADVAVVPNKIVYVGRLHPSKGVDVLIHAVSILLHKGLDVHLDIIGGGLFEEKLLEQVLQLGIKDHVFFLGGKTKREVLTAFKEAYCVVIPSHSEAFGFTVIEAMSVGTCVIGANNTGIKEIIVPNQTGLLFDTGNAIDLAAKLEDVFNSLELRNSLSQNGFQRFLNTYETNYAVDRDYLFFKKNL